MAKKASSDTDLMFQFYLANFSWAVLFFFARGINCYASFIAEMMTDKQSATVCDTIHRQQKKFFSNWPDTPDNA